MSLPALSWQDEFSVESVGGHLIFSLLLRFRIPFLKVGAFVVWLGALLNFIVNAPGGCEGWSCDPLCCSLCPDAFELNVNNGMSLLVGELGLDSCGTKI